MGTNHKESFTHIDLSQYVSDDSKVIL